jgi:hypothetical protein
MHNYNEYTELQRFAEKLCTCSPSIRCGKQRGKEIKTQTAKAENRSHTLKIHELNGGPTSNKNGYADVSILADVVRAPLSIETGCATAADPRRGHGFHMRVWLLWCKSKGVRRGPGRLLGEEGRAST